MFLIANIKFLNFDFEKLKEFQKKFAETDAYIKELIIKYDLKIHYINIDTLKIFKNQIRKFISLAFIKKGVYDVKSNNQLLNKRKTISKDSSDKNRRSLNNLIQKDDCSDILET